MKYLAAFAMSVALFPVSGYGDTTKKDLVKACVEQKKLGYMNSHVSTVHARGGVECPSADTVGFPPRERKHNRDQSLVLDAGSGRVFCGNPEVTYEVHSENGGGRGNYSMSDDRKKISLPIYCRGAGLAEGRRWYEVTIFAKSCPMISDDQSLSFLRECAGAL